MVDKNDWDLAIVGVGAATVLDTTPPTTQLAKPSSQVTVMSQQPIPYTFHKTYVVLAGNGLPSKGFLFNHQ